MTPRIAIPVPTSSDVSYNRRSWPMYADAIERSMGESVRLELGTPPSQLREVLSQCQGVLLPGSPADVQPSRYGQPADPLSAPPDVIREACDNLLLEEADRKGMPVLGICFGLQSLNVWRGGSLIQHLSPMPVNHAAGPAVAIAHPVLIANESLLGSLVDREEATAQGEFRRLPINTSHHQAVAIPGAGLQVVARSPDEGVIEAVEAISVQDRRRSQFLLGVQWHPERSFDISATSRALFSKLVTEAALWAERVPTPLVR